MPFLPDLGVPHPPLSTRLASLFDRIEWPAVLPFAVLMATIIVLQGSMAPRTRPDSLGVGVCERQVFPTPNLFVLALH